MYAESDVMGMNSNQLRMPIGYGCMRMTSTLALLETFYIFVVSTRDFQRTRGDFKFNLGFKTLNLESIFFRHWKFR